MASRREATFRILGAKPDGWHRTAIKAVFADGASLERQVQFQGGWHVTVPFMRYKDTRP